MEFQEYDICPICSNSSILEYENVRIEKGKISVIIESPFYHCYTCDFEFSTKEMEDFKSKLINIELRKSKINQIIP